ncbi:MAG: CbiX/SirB N-terminal domain-containing protein [Betaproteobacteria bacterium]|nr:CbiX/SirB N-terminal domain-containing protein [Betaproteobacteria bacterium]
MPSFESSAASLSGTAASIPPIPSSTTAHTALILFAHGAREQEWAAPVHRVRAAIAARAPQTPVALAFLEFMPPDLETCLAALARDGVRRVVVIPMFIARSGHLKRDLPRRISALRAACPDVELILAEAVGEEEAVVQAIAECALAWTRDGPYRSGP